MDKLRKVAVKSGLKGGLNDIVVDLLESQVDVSGSFNDKVLALGKKNGLDSVTETLANIDNLLTSTSKRYTFIVGQISSLLGVRMEDDPSGASKFGDIIGDRTIPSGSLLSRVTVHSLGGKTIKIDTVDGVKFDGKDTVDVTFPDSPYNLPISLNWSTAGYEYRGSTDTTGIVNWLTDNKGKSVEVVIDWGV